MDGVQESIETFLDNHGVRDDIAEVVMWDDVRRSGSIFFVGLASMALVQFANVGVLTLIGSVAILQLLVYRTAEALQENQVAVPVFGELVPDDIDLKEVFIYTPDAKTISTLVEILGDLLKNTEEAIKELSLTNDLIKLTLGFGTLVFLAVLGRFLSMPIILALAYVLVFTVPLFYTKNKELIDAVVNNSFEVAEMFIEKNTGIIITKDE